MGLAMRFLASFAVGLLLFQGGVCGLRAPQLADLAPGAETAPVAMSHCGGATPPPRNQGSDEDTQRQCREHCEQAGHVLLAGAPAVDAPLHTATITRCELPTPLAVTLRMAREHVAPPGIPLPILHSALLI